MTQVGKLREPEARILDLQIAAAFPGHAAATTQIIDRVPKYRELSPEDLKPSKTRPGEEMWQQIVRNAMASHHDNSTSIFSRGYALPTEDGIRVTEKGLDYLRSQGLYE